MTDMEKKELKQLREDVEQLKETMANIINVLKQQNEINKKFVIKEDK